MWIMWITLWRNIICNRIKTQKQEKNREKSGKIEKMEKKEKEFMLTSFHKKIHMPTGEYCPESMWKMWITICGEGLRLYLSRLLPP